MPHPCHHVAAFVHVFVKADLGKGGRVKVINKLYSPPFNKEKYEHAVHGHVLNPCYELTASGSMTLLLHDGCHDLCAL